MIYDLLTHKTNNMTPINQYYWMILHIYQKDNTEKLIFLEKYRNFAFNKAHCKALKT